MLSVQNISDVAVTINFDQGHQNWHKNITFTGVYPTAQFEDLAKNLFKEDQKFCSNS